MEIYELNNILKSNTYDAYWMKQCLDYQHFDYALNILLLTL